ncbi:MAG: PIN domain-containing protein [candidate division KSB1 bacterium]|nr:PIN domain-containing protein [candidate division KSB1 bacterium]
MNAKYFIDTNIFVYAFDQSDKNKQHTANQLIQDAHIERKGCISYQVIQEFLNVATNKFKQPLSISDCQRYLQSVLSPLCQVFTSVDLYQYALDIMQRWKYSFYDSLIIAAAIQANCGILYSEDMQHGQSVGSLTILDPFL